MREGKNKESCEKKADGRMRRVSARLSLCPDCQVPEVAKYQKYTNTVEHI